MYVRCNTNKFKKNVRRHKPVNFIVMAIQHCFNGSENQALTQRKRLVAWYTVLDKKRMIRYDGFLPELMKSSSIITSGWTSYVGWTIIVFVKSFQYINSVKR